MRAHTTDEVKMMIRLTCLFALLFGTSCMRNSFETWEDIKTAGRYLGKGFNALCGKDYESRMLTSNEEVLAPEESEFIPLKGAEIRSSQAAIDTPLPQPKNQPGEKGIPQIAEFYSAKDSLEALFTPVHFETDQHVVRDKKEVQGLLELAKHLKRHPSLYIVVEGHADERASASYNMALGMRRSNYVRSFLVEHGVNPNQVYTVSYGKERPIALGHNASEWKMNRRSEFKMYQK